MVPCNRGPYAVSTMMICSKFPTPLDSLNRRLVYSPNMSHFFNYTQHTISYIIYSFEFKIVAKKRPQNLYRAALRNGRAA